MVRLVPPRMFVPLRGRGALLLRPGGNEKPGTSFDVPGGQTESRNQVFSVVCYGLTVAFRKQALNGPDSEGLELCGI